MELTRRRRSLALFLLLLCSSLLFLFSCGGEPAADSPEPEVTTLPPVRDPVSIDSDGIRLPEIEF